VAVHALKRGLDGVIRLRKREERLMAHMTTNVGLRKTNSG
jgi:hypothetical protein